MKKGKIEINFELCKMCEYCIVQCPMKLIKKGDGQNQGGFFLAEYCDPSGVCNACKLCGIVCPESAIEIFKIISDDCDGNCGDDCKCGKGGDDE